MSSFPQIEIHLLLPGPAGEIEALATPPKPEVTLHPAVAIICHPHPQHGGTMNNKVVTTLARVFSDLGLRTVRFNFRGVGKSTGDYAESIGETEDLLAIINWVKTTCPESPLWLAGFSFGAAVALRAAATQSNVAQLVCIAPPVPRFDILLLPPLTCPCVVVQGEKDDVVNPAEVYAWVKSLSPQPTLIRIPDADHFFHGQLLVLRDLLESTLG